jgi:SAM-dependent methyltransferase
MELIHQEVRLRSHMLDYGCGIGRMAKAMIDAFGCCVIGIDISPSMRAQAGDYVCSDRFIAASPGQLDLMVAAGLRSHAAIAVWVFQHCFATGDDIARIRRGLVTDGMTFVLNMPTRAIPVARGISCPGGGNARQVTYAKHG